MRIVPPVPAEEITSSAFAFNIRISDVDDALCERLETAISHYFSRNDTLSLCPGLVGLHRLPDSSPRAVLA